MRDPVPVVATLPGQRELPVVVVEVGAQRDQLTYGVRALGDQLPHSGQITGPRAGDQGVPLVLLGGVPLTEGGSDATLGPLRRPGAEHVLDRKSTRLNSSH